MFGFSLLFYLLASGTKSFRLYNTYISDNHDYKDCLYSFKSEGDGNEWVLIPYCIRQNVEDFDETDAQCYDNGVYTFDQLKSKNVNGYDLYSWHAPIDTINNYQRYLVDDDMSLYNNSYCNCSSRWFGTRCEYSFGLVDREVSFDKVIESEFEEKEPLTDYFDIIEHSSLLTCYEGLQCHSTICLDWRQICDGNMNCEYGEDEPDECLLLELNECQIDEYRCRNGMCIPKTFLLDFSYDCMDMTDEKDANVRRPLTILCYRYPIYLAFVQHCSIG